MVLRRGTAPDGLGAVVRLPGILGVAVALSPGPEVLGATVAGRARFDALVPLFLGIHVAVPLIVLGVKGVLFSPNNHLPVPWLSWLGRPRSGSGGASPTAR
jgi:hypothetical protein